MLGGTYAHTHWVASRVSAAAKTSGGIEPLHAAKTTLVIDNGMTNDSGAVGIGYLDDLYTRYADGIDTVDSNDNSGGNYVVDIVNVSWHPGSLGVLTASNQESSMGVGYDAWDHLVDYYVYEKRLNFVKPSGNIPMGTQPGEELAYGIEKSVTCDALNAVCVGSIGAYGTYGPNYADYADDFFLDTSSRYLNPAISWFNPAPGIPVVVERKDAERPDIVAEGLNALVATAGSGPSDWETRSGTSHAAPVIAGLMALVVDKCKANHMAPPSPERFRALLRAHAYVPQTLDPNALFYPNTPSMVDAKVGAGIVKADSLRYHVCNPNPPVPGPGEPFADDGEGDASQGVLEEIPWDSPEEVGADGDGGYEVRIADGGIVSGGQGLKASNKKMARLYDLGSLKAGSRVRATLSFSACPDTQWTPNEQAPVEGIPMVDFDLVLVDLGSSPPSLLAASETTQDTNEGFDYYLTRDAAHVVVAYTRPDRQAGVTECRRSSGQDYEPIGHAVVYWPND